MATQDIHRVGPYIIGNTLGAGVTGKVKLAFDKSTGEQVAIKIISKELISNKPAMGPKLEREIAVMKLMNHPNVLHMYDVFETSEYIFLVLEYASGGELFDFLVHKGALDTAAAFKVFHQIIEGLDYCQKHFICHRDLKPENILMDADKNIKLADFGMSALKVTSDTLFETSCGSPHYASPEVVQGISYDGNKADIWSCGVILFALVTGKLPFDDENIRKLLTKVKAGVFVMPPYLHKDIQDLISRMLTIDPVKRISIAEIKQHPWYTSSELEMTPIPVLEPSDFEFDENECDEDIVRSIQALGFGNKAKVLDAMRSDSPNMIKTFYGLYEERLNEPRVDKNGKKLSRAKSETTMKKVSKQPSNPSIRPSSRMLFAKTKKLTRRLSYNANSSAMKIDRVTSNEEAEENLKELSRTPSKQFQRIKLEPRNDNGTKDSLTPRKSWLPGWFGNSDIHLRREKKKNLKDGIESKKSIAELTHELEETLEALGATYSFTQKRDKIKARLTRDSRAIKFNITLLQVVDDEEKKEKVEANATPLHFISFSKKSGDRNTYNDICNNIKGLLNV